MPTAIHQSTRMPIESCFVGVMCGGCVDVWIVWMRGCVKMGDGRRERECVCFLLEVRS